MAPPRSLTRLLDVGTFLCAFVLTGLVAWRELAPRRAPAGAEAAGDVRLSDTLDLISGGHRIGPTSAAVTIVEFSDFQCPFCAHFAQRVLPSAMRRHPGELAVVYRHWPLSIHPFATDAAVAAECAGEQQRFREYHDALFAHQDSIGAWSFGKFGALAAVPDSAAFRRCRSSEEIRARVEHDRRTALDLGARGTPTFIVNGVMLAGALDSARIDSLVRAARP